MILKKKRDDSNLYS